MNPMPDLRKRIELQGVVQGVGFRPFVFRIARRCDVRGWVLNSSEGVVIEAEGSDAGLVRFLSLLKAELPPLARIDSLTVLDQTPRGDLNFAIEQSVGTRGRFSLVPPDIATCSECAADFSARGSSLPGLISNASRRVGYPFTNCTSCGPRYTIICDVP